MEHFYIYSFTLAVIPLLLGLHIYLVWEKIMGQCNEKNEEYQQRTPDVLLCV